MAPNPKVAKACRAMKNIGITQDIVKPVLTNLLKLYEKNWDFIEEENYRILIEAILEKQEGQVAHANKNNQKAEAQVVEGKKKYQNAEVQVAETKRKRRNADFQIGEEEKKCCNAAPEKVDEEAEGSGQPGRPLRRLRLRYRENQVSTSSGRSNPKLGVNSKHLQLQTVDNSHVLFKPEDEPLFDDLEILEVVLPDIHPVPLCIEQDLDGNDLTNEAEVPNTPPFHSGESSSKPEIAYTASGEMKISMNCIPPQGTHDFLVPSLDELFKRTEEKCLISYKFLDPSFSVRKILNELRECALELGTPPLQEARNVPAADDISTKNTPMDVEIVTKEPLVITSSIDTLDAAQVEQSEVLCLPPTSIEIGQSSQPANQFSGKRSDVIRDNEESATVVANSHHLMVVEHLEKMPLQAKPPICFVNDISKGLENVVISFANEVNNDHPPAFHYIPSNIKFENADVGFSLARIGDNCCSTCIGDCVSNPCACAHETEGVVYTSKGLVRDDFLEECISMNRDPRMQSLFYCKDCPLERSKQVDSKEGCKGHFARKFIKECWWKCGCNGQCGNRVVQRGINRSLQVFMTPRGKGWGLRTLEDLPRGAFVCEFVGEIITNKELYTRMSESSSKHEFPVVLDSDWNTRAIKDEEALCLDAVYYGNVARFINHRCYDANLIGIPVEVDTPERHYYRFAFFTTRNVDALEELTRDYGVDFDDHGNQFKTFECLCESKFCRNLRRMTRSRSTKKRAKTCGV